MHGMNQSLELEDIKKKKINVTYVVKKKKQKQITASSRTLFFFFFSFFSSTRLLRSGCCFLKIKRYDSFTAKFCNAKCLCRAFHSRSILDDNTMKTKSFFFFNGGVCCAHTHIRPSNAIITPLFYLYIVIPCA